MSADNPRGTSRTSNRRASQAPSRQQARAATREHILAAAAELAREKGAAHISIEAIAERAGLSKGGLLYHFPRKDALIQALVEQHMAEVDATLASVEAANGHRRSNVVARTFVEVHREAVCHDKTKFDGVLLALAENPHLLDPIRAHEARVVERIRKTASDPELSLVAVLLMLGIRTLYLFEMGDILSDAERAAVLKRMLDLLAEEPEGGGADAVA